MEKGCVFIFSGTGMTAYVVSKIKDELEKKNLTLDVIKIEDTLAGDISMKEYDIAGIAYPVHSFNAPQIVINFARELPMANGVKTFIISTAGDESVLNHASSNLLMQILLDKKYNVFYNRQFIMPSNFMTRNSDEVVTKRLEEIQTETPAIASAIIEQTISNEAPNFISKITAAIGRLEWIGAKRIGKYFYSDGNCTGCGLCVERCPNNNIAKEEVIAFKKNCGLCMRCLYFCPSDAIKIRKPFGFMSIGDWYNNEELNKNT